MRYAVISGTSRGIGRELQQLLLERNIPVIALNRDLMEDQTHPLLQKIVCDLSRPESLETPVDQLFSLGFPGQCEEIWVIHNAAVIGNIAPLERQTARNICRVIDTNLTAPVILNALLLRRLMAFPGQVRIAHISSGAAFQPIHGLGSYCVSKAGLEMASRVIDEEAGKDNRISITIGPGVVDTGMQEQLRASMPENFRDHARFMKFKEKEQLRSSRYVAEEILRVLERPELRSGSHISLD